MREMKSPGALAAAGALEIDQLGSTVVSIPIASLHQLQALRIVSARTPYCRFNNHSLNGTRIIVISTRRPFLDAQRLRDLGERSIAARVPGTVIRIFRPNAQHPTDERA